jgi:hypothetical protein
VLPVLLALKKPLVVLSATGFDFNLCCILDVFPKQAHYFFNRPNAIRDSSFHCWRNAQSLMNTAKVIVHEVKRDGIAEIVDFLGECASEALKTAHLHTAGWV